MSATSQMRRPSIEFVLLDERVGQLVSPFLYIRWKEGLDKRDEIVSYFFSCGHKDLRA